MTSKAAIIGGGWAARFLFNSWDVAVFDPDPQAPRKVEKNHGRRLPRGLG